MKKLILILLLVVVPMSAETRYLVSANNSSWKTDALFSYPADSGTTYDLTINPKVGFVGNNFTLGPRSQVLIRNYGVFQSEDFGVSTYVYDPREVHAETRLTFEASSYIVVPALELKLQVEGDTVSLDGISNDGETNTDLAIFNLESYDALATISVTDAEYSAIGTERLTLKPGLNFYRLQTPLDIGSITIYNGALGLGFSYGSRIVGFALVGKNGTPKVLTF